LIIHPRIHPLIDKTKTNGETAVWINPETVFHSIAERKTQEELEPISENIIDTKDNQECTEKIDGTKFVKDEKEGSVIDDTAEDIPSSVDEIDDLNCDEIEQKHNTTGNGGLQTNEDMQIESSDSDIPEINLDSDSD
jgi:hypothetical protein